MFRRGCSYRQQGDWYQARIGPVCQLRARCGSPYRISCCPAKFSSACGKRLTAPRVVLVRGCEGGRGALVAGRKGAEGACPWVWPSQERHHRSHDWSCHVSARERGGFGKRGRRRPLVVLRTSNGQPTSDIRNPVSTTTPTMCIPGNRLVAHGYPYRRPFPTTNCLS